MMQSAADAEMLGVCRHDGFRVATPLRVEMGRAQVEDDPQARRGNARAVADVVGVVGFKRDIAVHARLGDLLAVPLDGLDAHLITVSALISMIAPAIGILWLVALAVTLRGRGTVGFFR